MKAFTTFDELFRGATGFEPYCYQRRLALAEEWPNALEVPTGAGKTAAAVLAWLWRRRFAATSVQEQTGRRLVICLPMRSLTVQTAASIERWLERLQLPDSPRVHTVMGGAVDDEWMQAPERDAILVGTQDMLLSRALNRGFVMSRYQWPMAFGLLHTDVQWIFDEVQLMGVGATTSAQLDALRRAMGTFGPQGSLWMSATLERDRLATVDRCTPLVGETLTPEDRAELAHLLTARKRVHVLRDDASSVHALATSVVRHHVSATRTLVVVNQVRRAQDLYLKLRRIAPGVQIALLHSRFRPPDRAAIEREVLRADWHGILVATQVVEAGIDISARTLFSDIAPWSSLVQRFGRCNRYGEYADADVFWIDVDQSPKACGPYDPPALAWSRETLRRLDEASPQALASVKAPPAGVVLPVIRRRDLIDLFDTTPDLAGADVDVSPYIRDGDETDVHIAWRRLAPGVTPGEAISLPSRQERCAIPIGEARALLARLRERGLNAYRWDHRLEAWIPVDRPVPGHVWIVPSDIGGYHADIGFASTLTESVGPVVAEGDPTEGEGGDVRSWSTTEATLEDHSQHVVEVLEALLAQLSWLPEGVRQDLRLGARWHDAGKAHPVFQRTMQGSDLSTDRVLAKSTSRRRHERSGFRHEIASALMLLARQPEAFRAAYVVAAHHGRARLVVRARPGEPSAPDGRRFALGVWDGDVVPAVALGGSVRTDEVTLQVGQFQFGGGETGMGWTARATALRDELGPFRLAIMEALLRAADWRASASARPA